MLLGKSPRVDVRQVTFEDSLSEDSEGDCSQVRVLNKLSSAPTKSKPHNDSRISRLEKNVADLIDGQKKLLQLLERPASMEKSKSVTMVNNGEQHDRCFTCDQAGHFSRDCPKKTTQSRSRSRSPSPRPERSILKPSPNC